MSSPGRPIPDSLGHIPPDQIHLWGRRLGNNNTQRGGTPPQGAEEGVLVQSEPGGELVYKPTHQHDLPARDQSTLGTLSPTDQSNVADRRNPTPGQSQYVGLGPVHFTSTNSPHTPSTPPPQYSPMAVPSPQPNMSTGEPNLDGQWVQHLGSDPVHISYPIIGIPSTSSSPPQYHPSYAVEYRGQLCPQPDPVEHGPAGFAFPVTYVSQPAGPTPQILPVPGSFEFDRFGNVAYHNSEFASEGGQANEWDAQDPHMTR